MKEIKKQGQQYRQGDVLLVEAAKPSGKGKAIKAEQGRKVLAHGEVTGHAHALPKETAVVEFEGVVWVLPEVAAPLTHEEHDTVTLSPDTVFIVGRQVEFSPKEERLVAD